jgi:hypothetical protein
MVPPFRREKNPMKLLMSAFAPFSFVAFMFRELSSAEVYY